MAGLEPINNTEQVSYINKIYQLLNAHAPFIAGQLQQNFNQWQQNTSDQFILNQHQHGINSLLDIDSFFWSNRSLITKLILFCPKALLNDQLLKRMKYFSYYLSAKEGPMKVVFNSSKQSPKYSETLDVNVVLDYMALLYPLDNLSLKERSMKLVVLLALTSGQRCQTLTFLDIASMNI